MLKNNFAFFKLKTLIVIFLIPVLSLGFLVGSARAEGAANNVVISEILFNAQDSDEGKEFIELYNPLTNPTANSVNLAGWSLKYIIDELPETKSLVTFSNNEGSKLFSPNGFFLIGFNGYIASNYNNILADVTRGAFLPNGEKDGKAQKITVILLDKQDNEIDRMSYSKDSIIKEGQSLERKAYQNNSCVSAQNSGENLGNGCDTGSLDDFEVRPVPNPQNSQSAAEPAIENPVTAEPTPTASPNLSPEPSSSPVLPVAEAGADKEAVIGENIDFDGSDSYDPTGKILKFSWDFGDKTSGKGINVSHSYSAIGEYTVILKVDNGESASEDTLKIKIIAPEFSDKIILSEILPNPIGVDTDGEWIELYNSGDKKVNLKGWILASGAKASGKQYIFSGDNFIEAKSYLTIKRSASGLVLTNESGRVSLIWPADKILSEVFYSAAKEGKSYVFVNNAWQWVDIPTPGKANSAKTATPAVSKSKDNSILLANISENINLDDREVLNDGEELSNSAPAKSAIFKNSVTQSAAGLNIEDFLNQLISEKVDNAILKARANETAPQEKTLALADNVSENGSNSGDKESICKDFCLENKKGIANGNGDVRNNPWFYGDIALSVLSLFLVWRYQEARKRLK